MPKEDLIRYITDSPVRTTPELNLALIIASCALHGATTRDGRDYDLHYLTVGMGNTRSRDKMVIGILHDVIEDTDWTIEDLRRVGFEERIALGVDGLTKRPGEKYFDFIERCALNPDSIDLKLEDLEHNSTGTRNERFPTEKELRKQRVYIVAYQYLVAVKKGDIQAGTPMSIFMQSYPELNDARLLAEESSHPQAGALRREFHPAEPTPRQA